MTCKRVATVAIIHSAGDPRICGALAHSATAKEIERLNARLAMARYAQARDWEAKIIEAERKYRMPRNTRWRRMVTRAEQALALLALPAVWRQERRAALTARQRKSERGAIS